MPDFITIPVEISGGAYSVSTPIVADDRYINGWSIIYTATSGTVMIPPQIVAPPVAPTQEEEQEERAWRMVRGLLSAQEKRLLARYDYLPIKSRLHPGFTYRLTIHGSPPDVYYRGECVGGMCINFYHQYLPDADTFLMHKLWLEADEKTYLATANLSREEDTPSACAWLEEE